MRNAFIAAGVVLLVVAGVATYYLLKPAKPNDFPPRPENAKEAKAQQPARGVIAPDASSDTVANPNESTPTISEADAMDGPSSGDKNEFRARTVKVYGTVIDAATGAPVAGALVFTGNFAEVLDRLEEHGTDSDAAVVAEGMTASGVRDMIAAGKELTPGLQKAFDLELSYTDESGAYSYAVDVFPQFGTSIHCRAKGFAIASRSVTDHRSESVRFDFQMRVGASIAGKVTNAETGVPVAGIKVRAMTDEGDSRFPWSMPDPGSVANQRLYSAKASEDGAFVIENLPAGDFAVRVSDEIHGWMFDLDRTVNLTLADAEEKTGVDLVVTEGLRVVGTITDEDGNPVEGALVSGSLQSGPFMAQAHALETPNPSRQPSQADGHYAAVGLWPGPNRISASHKDFATVSTNVSVAKDAAPPELNFTLVKGTEVAGTATYEDGSPAVSEMLFFGRQPSTKDSGPTDFFHDTPSGLSSTDDQSGEFRFEHVPAGEYELTTDPTPRRGPKLQVHVDGKNPVTGLQITIPKEKSRRYSGEAISGTVLDREGSPAPNVGMWAVSDEGGPFSMGKSPDPDERTDKDGAFTLEDLEDDVFTVYAESDRGETSQPNVKLGDTITLRLGPVTAVSGVVVDANGDAVPGCNVELTKPRSDEPDSMASMMTRMMGSFMPGGDGGATTDDFGQFTFKHIEAGSYIVEAKSAGKGFGASDSIAVVKGTEKNGIRVVLEAGASFAGIVVDGSGSPVQGANVSLIESMGGPMEDIMANMPMGMGPTPAAIATSGADGAFALNGLKPGTFTLSAKHADFAPFTAKGVDVSSNQSSPYRVTLGKGGSARGQFLADGQPKGNVMIQLMGPGGMQMAMTDSEGRFEVKGLPAGTYMVMPMDIAAMQQGGEDMMPNMNFKSVEITEGGDVVIPFGGGVAVTGSVPAEHLGKMTFVYLMRKGAPDMSSMLGGLDPMDMMGTGMQMMQYMAGMAEVKDDGSFALSNVDPGEYDLRVYASDVNMDEIDPEAYMNMSFEEMQQQSQAFMPKEVFKQPIIVGNEPLAVQFAAPTAEQAP